MTLSRLLLAALLALSARSARASDPCLGGTSAPQDRLDVEAVREAIEASCPCSAATSPSGYAACARGVVRAAVDGAALRKVCKPTVNGYARRSTCGRVAGEVAPCLRRRASAGATLTCALARPDRCASAAGSPIERHSCPGYSHCIDAADGNGDGRIGAGDALRCAVRFQTTDIASAAQPPNTPGTPGVVVTNPKLITQFGSASFDLNRARYTRFRAAAPGITADAILVLVPGFEGGAGDFRLLAENLIPRVARDYGLALEVWGFDRRTNQLEDRAGAQLAESLGDASVALDWYFGGELGLTLDPALAAGPGRRAVFYDPQADVPFLANWTNLVFSRDIDAVVQAADAQVKNHNVFLGGHSAGTGFAARYAATDFNLTGMGPAEPGYAKLRGLVLLEGGGGSTSGTPPTEDQLNRIVAKFDGGLFGAVRDNAPRCVDGTTACTVANEVTDCADFTPPVCTPPTTSYANLAGLLNPRILAAVEPGAIQGFTDPDGGQIIIQADQGAPGNNAVAKVPDLLTLGALPKGTVMGGIGSFIDDDGAIAGLASFVATSVGAPGPTVGGLLTWQDITEGPMPPSAVPNNGPAPTAFPPAAKWGQEKEVTRFDRMLTTFVAGGTNFTDWYYPSAGPSTTSGLPSLDSSALSVGRGRRDIENLTQAANIDIPVIGFGGSNGLAPVPGSYLAFASSIAPCNKPSCDGTPRVVSASTPSAAFPTFGDAPGGFETHISEGFAHVDVLTAEDTQDNHVLGPLAAFLARNAQ